MLFFFQNPFSKHHPLRRSLKLYAPAHGFKMLSNATNTLTNVYHPPEYAPSFPPVSNQLNSAPNGQELLSFAWGTFMPRCTSSSFSAKTNAGKESYRPEVQFDSDGGPSPLGVTTDPLRRGRNPPRLWPLLPQVPI